MKIEIGKISGGVLWLLVNSFDQREGEFPVEDALREELLRGRSEEDYSRHGRGRKHLEFEVPVLRPHQALAAGFSLQRRMIKFVESFLVAVRARDEALVDDIERATEVLLAIAIIVQERALLDLTRAIKAPTN